MKFMDQTNGIVCIQHTWGWNIDEILYNEVIRPNTEDKKCFFLDSVLFGIVLSCNGNISQS